MDVTLWVNEMEVTKVSDLRLEERGAWTVVHAEQRDGNSRLSLHVNTEYPRAIERGRAFVAALTAALDAVEAAHRETSPVDIRSLAPDPVNDADKASVTLHVESDIERARRLTHRPDDAA